MPVKDWSPYGALVPLECRDEVVAAQHFPDVMKLFAEVPQRYVAHWRFKCHVLPVDAQLLFGCEVEPSSAD